MPFKQQQPPETVAPSETVSFQHMTFQTALQEWSYIHNEIYSNPDSGRHAAAPVFAVNVLETFGDNDNPLDEDDDDMEDFRNSELDRYGVK